jgi:hypothetical protein
MKYDIGTLVSTTVTFNIATTLGWLVFTMTGCGVMLQLALPGRP